MEEEDIYDYRREKKMLAKPEKAPMTYMWLRRPLDRASKAKNGACTMSYHFSCDGQHRFIFLISHPLCDNQNVLFKSIVS